jgi:hypothetical protein
MNEDDRIDLSPLDATRDPGRWEARVEATLARLDPVLAARRRQDPLTLIAQWSRPVIAASALALAILVPVEAMLERREPRVEQVQRLVALSAGVTGASEAASAADFLRALGAEGAAR